MKKLSLIFLVITVFSFILISCEKKDAAEDIWENAIYSEDAVIGEGEKTLNIVVEAEGKKITITLKTDRDILSEALLEHSLISGDDSQYGMYVTTVNGILADFNKTKMYWALYKNGEYLMTGAESTEISDGEQYEFVYSK